MSAVRDLTHPGTTDVAFEVERVGWPSPERVEVVGRWFGVRGRRFIRPTLQVEVDGHRRRLLAVLDHKPWAVEDGQDWVAAFDWQGEPVDLTGSELTVGPDIAVELTPPGEKRRGAPRRFARRPRADVLEAELAAAREKGQQLARDLHAARAEHAADLVRSAAEQEAEIERVRAEHAAAQRDAEHRTAELRGELDAERERVGRLEATLREVRGELAVARADVAAQHEEVERERAVMASQATRAAAGEVDRLRRERDEASRETDNARAERDLARRESATARGERDAAIRDRDRARQERQVLLSRVRTEGEKRRVQPASPAREATPTIPAPPIVSSAPSPKEAVPAPKEAVSAGWSESAGETAPWAARAAALAALVVLVLLLVLLLTGAL